MYKPKMGIITKKPPNKPMMAKGGMVKSNCGASVKPAQKGKK